MLGAAMRQNPDLSAVTLMPKALSTRQRRGGRRRWACGRPGVAAAAEAVRRKPAGYVLWPPHRMDLPAGRSGGSRSAKVLRTACDDQYRRGNSHHVRRRRALGGGHDGPERVPRGDAGRTGGRAARRWWLRTAEAVRARMQRGRRVELLPTISATSHLFLGKDTDERNIRSGSREIGGGIDPARGRARSCGTCGCTAIGGQTVSEKLYLDKRGPYMALHRAREA